MFNRNLLIFLFMSSGILRIFYAEYITEAIFQITALRATKKKALGGIFLIFFFFFQRSQKTLLTFLNKYVES